MHLTLCNPRPTCRIRLVSIIVSIIAALSLCLFGSAASAQQQAGEFPAQFDRLGVSLGNPDAELVVREFADYQCPACRAFSPTIKRLIDEYVASDRVRFVFFDFPLDMHEHAVAAAEAARCAGLQQAYWPMHNALFDNQQQWAESDDPVGHFADYADAIGIDNDRLAECVRADTTLEIVEQSRQLASRLGVRSTPTLVVGNTALPGVASWDDVAQVVERALAGEPPTARQASAIRPQPLDPDRELMTVSSNRMAEATSPYLQLHADNPVDWYPWGDAAFAKAERENKLVFLSIGYFTCYWCHVMERESFSDPEVADLLNRYFVAIKVDREQRPGVDSLYMRAINVLGQRGGWPLSMFVTPQRKPFFGGTYYPKPQFINALDQMHAIWQQDPDRITNAADQVTELLARTERAAGVDDGGEVPATSLLTKSETTFERMFNAEHGGFGPAPKFPQPSILLFLLDRYRDNDDPQLLKMVTTTLDAMAAGGIRDHLGGGFHRYSTDARWHVPHFEKMLYDNAQLFEAYTRAWEVAEKPEYRAIVAGIVDYLDSTLTDPDTGLLYSAQSSLVEHDEGESYVWTEPQFLTALDDQRLFQVARLRYGLDDGPDLEGTHVLHIARRPDEIAAALGNIEPEEVARMLPKIDAALLQARNAREQAPVGIKHVLSWNALAIRALAHAGRVMEEPAWIVRAERLADAVMTYMYRAEDGPWLAIRGTAPGEVSAQSFDYAALVAALVELEQASGQSKYGNLAATVAADMIKRLWNPERGLFDRRTRNESAAGELLVETTALRDGAVPAGNSVAALALTELARAGFPQYAPYAATVLRAHMRIMDQNPGSLPLMLTALSHYHAADLPDRVVIPTRERIDVTRVAFEHSVAPPNNDRNNGEDAPGLHLEGIGGGVAASGEDSMFSGAKVEMNVVRDTNDPRRLRFKLTVDDGWHLNANPASLDFLVPTKVRVYIGNREIPVQSTYPTPHQVTAEALDEGPIDVYSGSVTIASVVPTSTDPDAPLAASVRIQACNDSGRCLAPDTLEQTIKP